MSTPLHPDLANLDARYAEIGGQVQNQEISLDDAVSILDQTVAIDADGREWRINAVGEFTSNLPGEQPVASDPTLFAENEAVTTPQAPWGIQPPTPTGGGMFGPNGGGGPSSSFIDEGPDGGAEPEMPRMMNLGGKAAKEPKARSLADSEPKAIVDKVLGAKWGGTVRANKRPLIIGVVALVVVLFFAARGGSGDPDSGIPATGDTTIPTMPTDTTAGEQPTETTAAPAPAALPTDEEVRAVLSQLQSGDRAVVAGLVANPGDEATIAIRTAQYAGYAHSGLGFLPGPVAEGEAGVVSDVSVVDAATETVYRTGKVRWVRAEAGHWQIAEHIDVTPPAG